MNDKKLKIKVFKDPGDKEGVRSSEIVNLHSLINMHHVERPLVSVLLKGGRVKLPQIQVGPVVFEKVNPLTPTGRTQPANKIHNERNLMTYFVLFWWYLFQRLKFEPGTSHHNLFSFIAL